MIARIIRADLAVSEKKAREVYGDEFVDANTHKAESLGHYRLCWKPGTELTDADCWKLVRLGWAEPVDEECQQRSPPAAIRYRAQERTSKFVAETTKKLKQARNERSNTEDYSL